MNRLLLLRSSIVLAVLTSAPAYAVSLLNSTDPIIAIDTDYTSLSSSPPGGGEDAIKAIDGDYGSKYLNFGKEGSGYILSLPAAQAFRGLWLSTANDAAERDPVQIAIYGTNNAITSTAHSPGMGEKWTFLSRQTLSLTTGRNVRDAALVSWTNDIAYASYRFVVESIRTTATANSMQIAETRFTLDGAGTQDGLTSGGSIIPIDYPDSQSSYPAANEFPRQLLDTDPTTKYLNFGREHSGFIVTPGVGSSIVTSMTLTTANDAEGRDPATYSLYGTNDKIVSADDSAALEETWTLISSGALPTSATRLSTLPDVTFSNSTAYTSYRLVFDTVVNPTENSMQLGGIQFGGTVVPEPASAGLLALGSMLALRRRRTR